MVINAVFIPQGTSGETLYFLFECTYILLLRAKEHSLLCPTMFLEFRLHVMRDEYILFHFILSIGISSSISTLNKNSERRMSSGTGSGKLNVRFQPKLYYDSIISDIISNTVLVFLTINKIRYVSFRVFLMWYTARSGFPSSYFFPCDRDNLLPAELMRRETLSYLFHFTFCKLA